MRRTRPALAVAALACLLAACSSGGSGTAAVTRAATPRLTSAVPTATVPATVAPVTTTPAATTATPSTPAPSTTHRSSPSHTASSSAARRAGASRLPLSAGTGNATQVITVVGSSHSSTVATLQAWTKVSGGWRRSGPSMTAHVGSGGIGRASEGSTRTPAGSFTLTQAFGHDSDPGTRLPYTHTTPADWWISQTSSPLYNTRQRCSSGCSFTRGDPNEHLYYETPYYDYAVVIDYNTANAPGGVRAGAGSAFFLHVTDGNPTAGCVSIPQQRLLSILRWLRPADHPRILIGVG